MHFRMAGYTSAGMVRQKNEDCFAILPSHQGAFLADGMGGVGAWAVRRRDRHYGGPGDTRQ